MRNWRDGENGFLQVGELASRCDTSQKYLEQVLLPLSHAGILESKRGQRGGYRLNRAPEDISLAEALRHLEGLLMPIPKWADDTSGDQSRLAQVLRQVRDSIREILENTSKACSMKSNAASTSWRKILTWIQFVPPKR